MKRRSLAVNERWERVFERRERYGLKSVLTDSHLKGGFVERKHG